MILYRDRFGSWVSRLAGGFGPPDAVLASGNALRTANRTWAVILVTCIAFSAAIINWLPSAIGIERTLAVLWGVFIGLTMLFYFPSKLLITLVGSVAGVGVTDLAAMADVLEKNAGTINSIVRTLNSAFAGDVTIHPIAAWLFLAFIILPCLLAYREQ